MFFTKLPGEIAEDVRKNGELILYFDANFLTKLQILTWVFEIEMRSCQNLTWFYQTLYEKKYIFIKGLGDLDKIRHVAKKLLPKLNELISSNLNEEHVKVPPFTEDDIDYYKVEKSWYSLIR